MWVGLVVVAIGAIGLAGYAVWQMSRMSERSGQDAVKVGETIAKAVGTWPSEENSVVVRTPQVPPVEEWEPELDRDPWMRQAMVGELPEGLAKVVEEHGKES